MEHNSNLFGDASFLAVPAIHFFGFPGYYTAAWMFNSSWVPGASRLNRLMALRY